MQFSKKGKIYREKNKNRRRISCKQDIDSLDTAFQAFDKDFTSLGK